MTKAQMTEHKIGNQLRREHFLRIYKGVKPSSKGWIVNPGFIQAGKHGTPNFDTNLSRKFNATLG